MDLEVVLEMYDFLGNSDNSAAKHDLGSQLPLNPADYDGAVYYFELVVSNAHASIDYTVSICDAANNVEASIVVPHAGSSVNPVRLRSTAWVPTSDTYHVYMPQTGGLSNIYIRAARIIVVQTGATKTRIQIPMTHAPVTSQVNYSVSALATPPWVETVAYMSYYKRRDSEFATISKWVFEAVHKRFVSGTSRVCLFDTSENQVTDALLSTTSDTAVVSTVDLVGTETNFASGTTYKAMHRNSSQNCGSYLYRSCIYVELTNLTKVHVYRRLLWSALFTGGVLDADDQRQLVAGADGCFLQTTAYVTTGTDVTSFWVCDAGTSDQYVSGSYGSVVSESVVHVSATSRAIVRSANLPITAGNRYILVGSTSSSQVQTCGTFLLVSYYNAGDWWKSDWEQGYGESSDILNPIVTRTLLHKHGIMEGRGGWFYDHYTPNLLVHYGEEGQNIHSLICGGIDSGIYQMVGESDRYGSLDSSPVFCQIRTPSRDQGDMRYNKLYGDIMMDCDTEGTQIIATPGFNHHVTTTAPNTVVNATRTQVPLTFGTEWQTARNVSLDLTWQHAGLRSYIYAWEPRFTEEGGKLYAYSWETCFLTHELHGYFYHGYLYLVHISNADLTFSIIAEDGTVAVAITVTSSGGLHHKDFLRLPVCKGKIFKYKVSSTAQFRVEGQESELLVKAWGSDGPWERKRIFQDVPRGEAA